MKKFEEEVKRPSNAGIDPFSKRDVSFEKLSSKFTKGAQTLKEWKEYAFKAEDRIRELESQLEKQQPDISKLKSEIDWLHGLLDERNEEVLQTVKLLNEAQPEIPEIPEFVSEFIEKNKLETLSNWNKVYPILSQDIKEWLFYTELHKYPYCYTLADLKINGYTVTKEKRFYLKHIEMSKRDVHHDYYAQIRNERFEHDSVESGTLPQPVITGVTFTQSQIDSMETGSYEQIPVEVEA